MRMKLERELADIHQQLDSLQSRTSPEVSALLSNLSCSCNLQMALTFHACLWIEAGERREGQVGVSPGAAGVHSRVIAASDSLTISVHFHHEHSSAIYSRALHLITQFCQARARELERLTSLASLQSEEAALELDGLRRRLSVSPLQWRSFLGSLQLQFALPAISSASSSSAASSYIAASGLSLTRPLIRPSVRPSLKPATNVASSLASNSLQKDDLFEVIEYFES